MWWYLGIGEVIMKRAAYALVLGCLGWLNATEAFAQQFDFAKFRDKISDKYKNVLLIGISKADERGSVTVYFSADTVAQVSMGQIQKARQLVHGNLYTGEQRCAVGLFNRRIGCKGILVRVVEQGLSPLKTDEIASWIEE